MNERELIEKAAMACGYNVEGSYQDDDGVTFLHLNPRPSERVGWSSLADSGDCAEMNAKLRLNTSWLDEAVLIETHDHGPNFDIQVFVKNGGLTANHCMTRYVDHNNDPLAAWRYASTVVAGMMGEKP